MKILDEVSKILKIHVTPNSLSEDVRILETSGKFDQRKIRELLVMIIKYLHDREASTIV